MLKFVKKHWKPITITAAVVVGVVAAVVIFSPAAAATVVAAATKVGITTVATKIGLTAVAAKVGITTGVAAVQVAAGVSAVASLASSVTAAVVATLSDRATTRAVNAEKAKTTQVEKERDALKAAAGAINNQNQSAQAAGNSVDGVEAAQATAVATAAKLKELEDKLKAAEEKLQKMQQSIDDSMELDTRYRASEKEIFEKYKASVKKDSEAKEKEIQDLKVQVEAVSKLGIMGSGPSGNGAVPKATGSTRGPHPSGAAAFNTIENLRLAKKLMN